MSDSHYALNADPPTYTQTEVDKMGELLDTTREENNHLHSHIIVLRQEVRQIMNNTKAIFALSRAFNGNDSLASDSLNMHIVIEQLCINSQLLYKEYNSAYPDCNTSTHPD